MPQVDKRSRDAQDAFNARNASRNTSGAADAQRTRVSNDRAKDALDATSYNRQGSHGWRPIK